MQFHFNNSKLEAIVILTLDANNNDVTLDNKKDIYRIMKPYVDLRRWYPILGRE